MLYAGHEYVLYIHKYHYLLQFRNSHTPPITQSKWEIEYILLCAASAKICNGQNPLSAWWNAFLFKRRNERWNAYWSVCPLLSLHIYWISKTDTESRWMPRFAAWSVIEWRAALSMWRPDPEQGRYGLRRRIANTFLLSTKSWRPSSPSCGRERKFCSPTDTDSVPGRSSSNISELGYNGM